MASGQEPAGKCYNSWAEFHRYNMARWNRCEKVLNVNNVGSVQLKWKYNTGREVDAAPIVANGILYAGSKNSTSMR